MMQFTVPVVESRRNAEIHVKLLSGELSRAIQFGLVQKPAAALLI
jgi:hypothetical protein